MILVVPYEVPSYEILMLVTGNIVEGPGRFVYSVMGGDKQLLQ